MKIVVLDIGLLIPSLRNRYSFNSILKRIGTFMYHGMITLGSWRDKVTKHDQKCTSVLSCIICVYIYLILAVLSCVLLLEADFKAVTGFCMSCWHDC